MCKLVACIVAYPASTKSGARAKFDRGLVSPAVRIPASNKPRLTDLQFSEGPYAVD